MTRRSRRCRRLAAHRVDECAVGLCADRRSVHGLDDGLLTADEQRAAQATIVVAYLAMAGIVAVTLALRNGRPASRLAARRRPGRGDPARRGRRLRRGAVRLHRGGRHGPAEPPRSGREHPVPHRPGDVRLRVLADPPGRCAHVPRWAPSVSEMASGRSALALAAVARSDGPAPLTPGQIAEFTGTNPLGIDALPAWLSSLAGPAVRRRGPLVLGPWVRGRRHSIPARLRDRTAAAPVVRRRGPARGRADHHRTPDLGFRRARVASSSPSSASSSCRSRSASP